MANYATPANKLSEEKVDEVVQLYTGGLSASKVQKITGVGFATVLRWVRKRGGIVRTPQQGKRMLSQQSERTYDKNGNPLKTCTTCETPQLETEFSEANESFDGLRGTCKTCVNKRRRDRYPQDREKKTARMRQARKDDPKRFRGYDLKKTFKMTPQDFEDRLNFQDRKCLGCGATNETNETGFWHVDHDHSCCGWRKRTCGKCVRGIICRSCNLTLGNAKDSPERLQGLAVYLINYKHQTIENK